MQYKKMLLGPKKGETPSPPKIKKSPTHIEKRKPGGQPGWRIPGGWGGGGSPGTHSRPRPGSG